MNTQKVHALIPAAGLSVRFGGTTLKQYAHLLGMPVMAHSMTAVMRHEAVESVSVALAPDDGIFEQLIRPAFPLVSVICLLFSAFVRSFSFLPVSLRSI